MSVYRWKNGSMVTGLDPQAVGEELEAISEFGPLTPERVLFAAQSKESPIHTHFEWDDTKAAHQHRKAQARGLIGGIEVEVSRPESEEAHHVRAFVRLGSQTGYIKTQTALAHSDTRQELLGQAWRELQSWKRRYEHLVEFAEIVSSIPEDIELAG